MIRTGCKTYASAARERSTQIGRARAGNDSPPGGRGGKALPLVAAPDRERPGIPGLARMLLRLGQDRPAREERMESILGIHESALLFRARRMDVLAENLANVDTPNYKARDVEFSTALAATAAGSRLVTTNPRHLGGQEAARSTPLQYRVPHQPSLDGNTVESDLELARFAENAVAYQASLLFINRRIAGLRTAITGGR